MVSAVLGKQPFKKRDLYEKVPLYRFERSKPFYGDLKQAKVEPGRARRSQVQPCDIHRVTCISDAFLF